jgi:hypothetical protein
MFSRQWTLAGDANGSANGDGGSYRGLYHAWGLGNQQFTDTSICQDGRASGDRWSKAAASRASATWAGPGA